MITRDIVAQWLVDWQAIVPPRPTKRAYIIQRLEAIRVGLSNDELDTSQRDDYADDTVNIVQVILDDLQSYV